VSYAAPFEISIGYNNRFIYIQVQEPFFLLHPSPQSH